VGQILVTGADGFIGSHLTESLVRAGEDVRALCQYNSFSSWGWLDSSECRSDIEVVLGDVRDSAQMHTVCRGIDTIYHLAALIGIPYSYHAPASYVATNISGTLNIMQAALDCDVNRVIHTSTSEVYGTARQVPIGEDHPLQAQSPYSATKIAADAIANSFHTSYGLPVITARPFNTYGPRQSARAVIPTVITQLLGGCKSLKLGAISPTRDFNYVIDTCQGFIELSRCEAALGRVVNIGSGIEITIGDTAKMIAELIGVEIEIECDESRMRPDKSEVERLIADNSLMKELTGLAPRTSLREGLSQTIEWFREPDNLSKYKKEVFNV
jgi:NAD dependent epimerase/dehydratase